MHTSALENAERFKDVYLKNSRPLIVEVGSQIVENQSSLRSVFNYHSRYIGIDFQEKKGVDIVLEDAYSFPLASNFADVVVSSSCFEHSEFFWLTFLEMSRICKEGGLIFMNTPSNGMFHRFPVDCWRFYPDSGVALQNWCRHNNHEITLLESFTSFQRNSECWNDLVAIFAKGNMESCHHPDRISAVFSDFKNGIVNGSDALINPAVLSEDMARLTVASQISNGNIPVSWD